MNYYLLTDSKGWAVGCTHEAPRHADASDIVAPWQAVELHPGFDGSPDSARAAILAWLASL